MTSSDQDGTWITISLKDSVDSHLTDFINTYGIHGKSNGVSRLLTIAKAAGIPLRDETPEAPPDEDTLPDPNTVEGFVFETDAGGMAAFGTEGTTARLVTDADKTDAKVQSLERTQITDGDVYCPVCSTVVLDYTLSELLPRLEPGIFTDISLTCPECNAPRHQYTLFVAQADATPGRAALKRAMQTYFAAVLVLDPVDSEEFRERITVCRRLSQDGDWNWLPDPDVWLGYEQNDDKRVTPRHYVEFLTNYTRALLTTPDLHSELGSAVSRLDVDGIEIMVYEPGETHSNAENTARDEWQFAVETQRPVDDRFTTEIQSLDDGWDTADLTVTEIEPTGFADTALLATVSGLPDTNE